MSSKYQDRVAASDRMAARADVLLAAQLEQQGRMPGSYSEAEYVAALEVAASEAQDEQDAREHMAAIVSELRTSPVGRNVVGVRMEVNLAAQGRTLDDVTDPDEYLALYAVAEDEVWPESVR